MAQTYRLVIYSTDRDLLDYISSTIGHTSAITSVGIELSGEDEDMNPIGQAGHQETAGGLTPEDEQRNNELIAKLSGHGIDYTGFQFGQGDD